MPTFLYDGKDKRGQRVTGEVDGSDMNAAASALHQRGIMPITIKPTAKKKGDQQDDILQGLFQQKPNLTDLQLFARQMFSLSKAGVPIIQALNGLTQSTRNKRLANVLKEVTTSLESGRDLSSSMARHKDVFSPVFINMVHLGEQTGRLTESFHSIAKYMEQERTTRERFKSATRYPMFVMFTIIGAIAAMNVLVVPTFSRMFEKAKAELPLPTKILMGSSEFTLNYWPHMLVLAVVLFIAFRTYVKTEKGRIVWGRLIMRTPIFGGIITRITLGRFASAFAMTIRAGVPITQALTIVANALDNGYVEERIQMMKNSVERGEGLTKTAVASQLFTPLVIQMLAVGEETGEIDNMMDEVADFYEREVDYDLKTLSDAIEPILIIVVGIMVLILALGIFLPMWDLSTGVIR
ncbi:MAG: type II secretion system F family protein [Candidatus Polarisedimenticolaceae bacterium]|nr:type II secretion system F family protein [Candidatus Polarisedimenticolaceae bacterium]